ncbi:unnamed protein product [Ceratitis capitata]|uniref:(Mediterranean fruit fly) hypothetical protein n=1 Tax=Ceratitis capitata TaxID=7213 RepID=A0A811URS1_CERCA|nr:unnamed protein product [Ceratitis capitata]
MNFSAKLARDTRVQAKLRNELLQTLRHEELCFLETLRLSPTVKYCRRICSRANVVQFSKSKSVQVDEGTLVCVPVYSIHHDPLIFCEPNSYIPERYENVAPKELMERRAFLPFGAGPRSCLEVHENIPSNTKYDRLCLEYKRSSNCISTPAEVQTIDADISKLPKDEKSSN